MEVISRKFRVIIFYDFKRGLNQARRVTLEPKRCYWWWNIFQDHSLPVVCRVQTWEDKFPRRTSLRAPEHWLQSLKTMSILWGTYCNTILESLTTSGSAAVSTILHDHLRVSKRRARWMPYQLPDWQRENRVRWCQFAEVQRWLVKKVIGCSNGWRVLLTRSWNRTAVDCVSVLWWRSSGQVQENQ